jgi:hypothetical protein
MSEIPARNAATARFPAETGRDATPAKIVCGADVALVVLVLRIATVW